MRPSEGPAPDESPLPDYLRVIRRRKWIVAALAVLAAVAAYAVSRSERASYEARAQMILTEQNLLANVSGQSPVDAAQAARIVQTNADLARGPAVAARTLAAAGVHDLTPGEFLNDSSVTPSSDADLLTFVVTNPDRDTAAQLATAYAQQFGAYRRDLDTASIDAAQEKVANQLKKLADKRGSATYNYLLGKSQELQSLKAVESPNAYVVHPAGNAAQVRPRPMRDAVLAGVVGLLLGVAVAFLVETLDTRVRSVDEIRDRLGLRILARIPPLRRRQRPLVMLHDPWSPQAEAFRTLRINLDVMNFQQHAKKIMVAGAQRGEGKSSTVANLAVALARAGRGVAVVDCDLHQPTLHRLFGIEPAVGLTDVLLGDVPLERALVHVDVGEGASARSSRSRNGSDALGAVVQVLAGGRARVEDKLVTGERIDRVLRGLEARAEYVLVDTPPLLQFSDGVGVSAHVDGVIVVVRLKDGSRSALDELQRLLAVFPTEPLGVVATAADGPLGTYAASHHGYRGREAVARAVEPDPSPR